MNKLPKWQTPPVHPAVTKLPMMTDAELDELAKDIKKNGLQEPIILWRDNSAAADGATGPFPLYLLDGRNRLAALKRIGITDPRRAKTGQGGYTEKVRILDALQEGLAVSRGKTATTWKVDTNPTTFVLSMNVRRRHLTPAQKRRATTAYLEADPTASNRKVARALGVDREMVGQVRKEAVSLAGSGHSDHLPIDRAKAVLRNDPTLSKAALMKSAEVSSGTALKARKELEQAGEIPPRTATSKPKPRTRSEPKPRQEHKPNYDLAVKRLRRELTKLSDEHLENLTALRPGEVSDNVLTQYAAMVDETAAALKAAIGRLTTNDKKRKVN
jgi:ParB-like nuclease domain